LGRSGTSAVASLKEIDMNASPIIRIVTTTAIAWMLASAVHAQAGRSRADVQAEAIAAAPIRS
jgi:hypothetical protein